MARQDTVEGVDQESLRPSAITRSPNLASWSPADYVRLLNINTAKVGSGVIYSSNGNWSSFPDFFSIFSLLVGSLLKSFPCFFSPTATLYSPHPPFLPSGYNNYH